MKVLNLTPHTINLMVGESIIEVPASGIIARCGEDVKSCDPIKIDGIAVETVKKGFHSVDNIPNEKPGQIVLVSLMVLNAIKEMGIERADLFAPDTGNGSAVRDENGRIKGVKRLIRL